MVRRTHTSQQPDMPGMVLTEETLNSMRGKPGCWYCYRRGPHGKVKQDLKFISFPAPPDPLLKTLADVAEIPNGRLYRLVGVVDLKLGAVLYL